MRGPACGGEFERGHQHMVGNLSERASRLWEFCVRGPAGGVEFECKDN